MSQDLQLTARLERPGFLLDVDLTLPGRGVTVLFGPSGSGKTSCLRVLAGLEPQARGVVRVDGEVWQDSAQGVMRPVHQRALGYVFQEASLFDHLSVRNNLMFGFKRTPPPQRRHAWDHGLELLGIAHLLERSPLDLSGGERQRARATHKRTANRRRRSTQKRDPAVVGTTARTAGHSRGVRHPLQRRTGASG